MRNLILSLICGLIAGVSATVLIAVAFRPKEAVKAPVVDSTWKVGKDWGEGKTYMIANGTNQAE